MRTILVGKSVLFFIGGKYKLFILQNEVISESDVPRHPGKVRKFEKKQQTGQK